MNETGEKEVKGQPHPGEECPKDAEVESTPASGTPPNNGPACLYKTQGTIASIDLMDKSFTIDPNSPYAFEQKKGDSTKKFILFVLAEDKDTDIKGAKILTCKARFKISADKDVDLGAIIALKNGREKIEPKVELKELKDDFDAETDILQVESLKTIK